MHMIGILFNDILAVEIRVAYVRPKVIFKKPEQSNVCSLYSWVFFLEENHI